MCIEFVYANLQSRENWKSSQNSNSVSNTMYLYQIMIVILITSKIPCYKTKKITITDIYSNFFHFDRFLMKINFLRQQTFFIFF